MENPYKSSESDKKNSLLEIHTSEDLWRVEPRQQTTGHIHILNHSEQSLTCNIDLIGLDSEWFTLSQSNVVIPAKHKIQISLHLHPPKHHSSRAGIYYFTVLISPEEVSEWPAQQRVALEVRPFYEFTIDALLPKRQQLSAFKTYSQTQLTLTNHSNAPLPLLISGQDESEQCQFEFTSAERVALADQTQLLIDSGSTIALPIQVFPPPRALFGISSHHYPYTITAKMLVGTWTTRSVLGRVQTRPIVGPLPLGLVIIGLIILGSYFFNALSTSTVTQDLVETQDDEVLPSVDIPVNVTPVVETQLGSNQITYKVMFQDIAAQYELDWRLLARQAYRESRLDPLAIGQSQDMGIMQIIPSTWDEWAPKVGVTDPFDPYSNVQVGAAYLAFLRDYFRERGYPEQQWMIIAYNWGPNNLRQTLENGGTWGDIPELQRRYALEILDAVPAKFDWQDVETELTTRMTILPEP